MFVVLLEFNDSYFAISSRKANSFANWQSSDFHVYVIWVFFFSLKEYHDCILKPVSTLPSIT